MPNSHPFQSSMKLKLWWRRMSISAPRMTIKTQFPLPLRLLILALVLAVGGGVLWELEQSRGGNFSLATSGDQIAQLKEQVESQRTMERSEQTQLESQVKALESDNAKLKEDLAFFESLLPVDANAQGVSIRRMKNEAVAPNQLHYQLLIMQGGKGDHDFIGNLQLTVTVLQAGKSAMIVFPAPTSTESDKFKLTFKHYQRVEGVLTLPEGAVIKAVQARILDKGQIRAQQSATL